MKKTIKTAVRKKLILIFVLLLAASGAGLLWGFASPLEREEETTATLYRQEAVVDYQVYLKENNFFPELALEPGRAYLASLTDYIETNFSYRFAGQEEALIQGVYSVDASITAFTGSERLKVWETGFELLPPTTFYQRGRRHELQEDIIIPYAEYAAFAQNITEETEFLPEELNLVVTYNIDVETETESGIFTEKLAPSLVIPLRGRVFTVEGNMAEERTNEITTTGFVPVPLVRQARTAFSITTGLISALLVSFLVFTEGKGTKISPAEKKLYRILKKHSERVVICKEKMPYLSPERMLFVKSFEDLVKVADEVGKPILYYHPEGKDSCFLVFNDSYVYSYTNGLASPPAPFANKKMEREKI
ncbi:MAG: DUF5305 domain-containing protein [Firmicutes bacterium]|nr:DUF5305 domain-containing protein [Bacillota bacterium]